MPWGTHAYIVSSRQAERMALTADMMIARSKHPVDDFHTTSWQLDGEDIKIDHYLSMYYSDLTPQDDRRRCVTQKNVCAAVSLRFALGLILLEQWRQLNNRPDAGCYIIVPSS